MIYEVDTFSKSDIFFHLVDKYVYPGKKSPGQLRRGREALKAICDNLENYSDFDERESPDEISISPFDFCILKSLSKSSLGASVNPKSLKTSLNSNSFD
ncbi:unnamed protein product [Caenorhabditis angaria]|uniref:Uncharacterized protein n=1 Tax=Caenorhabditis angaria TaxID=860376 RepID=A0A9P1N4G9_9PELO|nr:unnamed protein product [Caenorhabditis angaria]